MRSLKNRSLLNVNEDFEGEHNAEIHFLFSLRFYVIISLIISIPALASSHAG